MKKIKYILYFFFLSTFFLNAQESRKNDSIRDVISKMPDDSNKVNLIYNLGRKYDLYKSRNHIEYFITALDLAKKISYKQGLKKIYNSLIWYLFYKEMYDASMTYCLEYISFLEKENSPADLHRGYALMGNLLTQQGKYEEALKYFNLVRKFNIEQKDEKNYASTLTNICILHFNNFQYDSALVYAFRSVELFKRNNMPSEMANSILGIAEIQLKKENYVNAEERANEAYSIYSTINIKHGMCNSLYVIAQVNAKLNRTDSAFKTFSRALVIADSLNLTTMQRDCYKRLSEMYAGLKNYKDAYEYNILYKKYEDSIALNSQKGKMLEVEVKYDISKKENLLKQQEYELEKKNRQKNILIWGIAGILALLVISYRAYIQKKKTSKLISEQKHVIEEKQKEIIDSINYAKRIQSAILAKEEDIKQFLPESFLLYKPKDIVAGDFYFFEATNNNIFYAAADCTGHGVPGALVSVICSAALSRAIKEFNLENPGEILDKTREIVLETFKKSGQDVKDGMDISLICIPKNNKSHVKWSGANNPLWYIDNNGNLNEIKGDKQAIGFNDYPKPFKTHSIELSKNSIIYLFTDGFADQFGGPKGKKFKYKQLEDELLKIHLLSLNKQCELLNQTFINWKGNLQQVDDICIIGIRV